MASMVEREAASTEEMSTVAGVFYNRLKKDMKLESCASVQYILKERKTVLSTADTKIKSPYNTYLNSGLPVGPISSPGKASLEAALYPEDTEYMYFVLGKEGKHIFSKTYEEHLAAIKSNGWQNGDVYKRQEYASENRICEKKRSFENGFKQ